MKWLGSHRSFVVETFFTNSGSITATQRIFRTHFKLGRHDPVPSRNTILLWIKNFRKNGSALKRRSTGRPRTSTTSENAMEVKASVQQSPQRSARKHAAALRISATSVRRILHKELQMHPYKIMLAQELNENGFETRRALFWEIQQNVRWMLWCYTAMRLIFTCVVPLTSKTFATGLNLTLVRCMNVRCIVPE